MRQDKCTAIVLAAGKGKRMQSPVSKQFLELKGYPLIYYALKACQDSSFIDNIVLVTGHEDLEYCRKVVCEKYGLSKVSAIVAGGNERYDSVYEGLCACRDTDYVFIHDGARPFLDDEIISRCYRQVKMHGTAIAGMPSKDTVKIVDNEGCVLDTPDRSLVWNVQTPQVFSYSLVMKAYSEMKRNPQKGITDDAMVVERYSDIQVFMVEGSYTNIKVTTPEDMVIAEKILDNKI